MPAALMRQQVAPEQPAGLAVPPNKACTKVTLQRDASGRKVVQSEHIELVREQLTAEELELVDDAMISR